LYYEPTIKKHNIYTDDTLIIYINQASKQENTLKFLNNTGYI
jgi:hypothetical protein